ncbi:hypothetical protein RRSWK_05334 [Rhodopirellula sp. SWK7]|nr:hypothetical protein RRSWK_05334 [Rhodopirellula sp. SWK7]
MPERRDMINSKLGISERNVTAIPENIEKHPETTGQLIRDWCDTRGVRSP